MTYKPMNKPKSLLKNEGVKFWGSITISFFLGVAGTYLYDCWKESTKPKPNLEIVFQKDLTQNNDIYELTIANIGKAKADYVRIYISSETAYIKNFTPCEQCVAKLITNGDGTGYYSTIFSENILPGATGQAEIEFVGANLNLSNVKIEVSSDSQITYVGVVTLGEEHPTH